MTGEMHPLAAHHLPYFITAPGETDRMLWMVAFGLVAIVMLAGVLYFKLHALPEHLSHGRVSKTQFEIVGILALLALFTHNGMFWVAALLLAMIRIPNFETPLKIMSRALMRLAGPRAPAPDGPEDAPPPDTPDVAMPDLPATAGEK
jgi:hypothetical protein